MGLVSFVLYLAFPSSFAVGLVAPSSYFYRIFLVGLSEKKSAPKQDFKERLEPGGQRG